MSDAEEIFQLARDFQASAIAVWQVAFDEFAEIGENFAKEWRSNAMALADGGLLPGSTRIGAIRARGHARSITSERRFALGSTITVEAGPDASRRYGTMGLGFEYGSENAPAQHNALRALPAAERRLDKMVGTVEDALP